MGNKFKRFLLFCSGASEAVLAQTKCIHEYNKYAGIGASVLLTSLFAFLSGSYVLYFIFNSVPLALCSGLLWGAMIFNLDRFMVSTLRKRRVAQNLSTGERMRQHSHLILSAIPRLLFGVIISVAVATPLHLKLFEREIEHQIVKSNTDAFVSVVSSIKEEFSKIDQLEHQNFKLRDQIQISREKVDISFEAAHKELEGLAGTRVPGAGPAYESRREEFLRSETDLRELTNESKPVINQNEQLIVDLRAKRDALIEEARVSIQQANGLLTRLSALQELSTLNPLVKWTYLCIVLLFIFLEVTPLLVKLLSRRGAYDDLLDSLEGGIQRGGAIAERLVITEEQERARSLQLGVFILELILPARDKDYIVGDLIESYSNRPINAWASLWFYRQIFTSIAPLLFKSFRDAISRRINRF